MPASTGTRPASERAEQEVYKFTIVRPDSVTEAAALMADQEIDTVCYAGGTELVPLIKLGLARPRRLVDLKALPELGFVEWQPARRVFRIGPLTTHRSLEHDEHVQSRCPVIRTVERQIANISVRNTGTIGGNISFGDPQSDITTLFTALGCQLQLTSPDGTRSLPLGGFLVAPYMTALAPGELLSAVEIGPLANGALCGYGRIAFSDRPLVSAAIKIDTDGARVARASVAIGSVVGTPHSVPDAEAHLTGGELTALPELAADVAETVRQTVQARDDDLGSAAYKWHLAAVAVRRALNGAAQEAAL